MLLLCFQVVLQLKCPGQIKFLQFSTCSLQVRQAAAQSVILFSVTLIPAVSLLKHILWHLKTTQATITSPAHLFQLNTEKAFM